jgi:hypothetical protein
MLLDGAVPSTALQNCPVGCDVFPRGSHLSFFFKWSCQTRFAGILLSPHTKPTVIIISHNLQVNTLSIEPIVEALLAYLSIQSIWQLEGS